jgi:hypothetical protein
MLSYYTRSGATSFRRTETRETAPLAGADSHMAQIHKFTLSDPDIPAERKDPARWPELAQQEWGVDEGTAAAVGHRAALRAGLDLQQMVLHDIADGTHRVVERPPIGDVERLSHRDLYCGDMIAVPDGLQQAVGEAEQHEVVRLTADAAG